MCLGIPGQITGFDETTDQLARADVLGAERVVNVGMLTDAALRVGDWVIVHLGFALEVIDADEAAAAREQLEHLAGIEPGPPR